MACVAFDLDETIGNFQAIGILANLWSIDDLNTPEQLQGDQFKPSPSLKTILNRVKDTFAGYILRDKILLDMIIRPNIGELLEPLLAAKRSKHLKTMIIYSNTGNKFTVELAEHLLEHMFKVPNLFSVTADWWHPLRRADRVVIDREVIMHKRIETLQLLFQKALKTKKSIPLGNILFIDDRSPRHTLIQQVPQGLTYLVPTAFRPTIPDKQKEYFLFMAFAAMEKHGLFENPEYLQSKFCNRTIHVSYPPMRPVKINGVLELFRAVSTLFMDVEGIPWQPDSAALRKGVKEYLQNVRS
jgi:hypothetical protein